MKKLSFYALGAAMAAMLFAFTACDPANGTNESDGLLEVSPDKLEFSSAEGSKTVTVTGNNWDVTETLDWVSVEKAEGKFTVTVTANVAEQPRTGDITVANGEDSKTVTITQAVDETLTVDPAELNFDRLGETKTVAVTSNLEWTATEDEDWITVEKIEGAFTVSVQANDTTEERTSVINVTNGQPEQDKSVTIVQAASEASDDVRLVDKFNYTYSDGDSYGYQLSYDDLNRITKLEMFDNDYQDGEYETITYSYGEKTLTVNYEGNHYYYNDENLGEGEEPYWRKRSTTYVFNIDSEGRIISIASTSEKEWKDEVLVDEDNELLDNVFSYEGGYLKTQMDKSKHSSNYYIDYTYTYISDYVWTGGNLTKGKHTTTQTYDDDIEDLVFTEDLVLTSEMAFTYGNLDNPVKVSFDLNAFLTLTGYSEIGAMGFLGKSSKNLVSSMTHTYTYSDSSSSDTYAAEYDWTLDSEGYITKMTSTGEDEYTYTMTVTYKN